MIGVICESMDILPETGCFVTGSRVGSGFSVVGVFELRQIESTSPCEGAHLELQNGEALLH